MTGIQTRLQKLAAVSARLGSASDEFNETIGRIEDDIGRTRVGLSVWAKPPIAHQLVHSDPRENQSLTKLEEYWELGYTKLSDGWHIAVREVHETGDPDAPHDKTDPIALVRAPRHVRLEAVLYLDSLVEALIEAAESYAATVESANATLQEWDQSLSEGAKAGPHGVRVENVKNISKERLRIVERRKEKGPNDIS